MTMRIFDCEQGSEAWRAARLGIPTASMFHTVMAKGRDGGESITRKKYMCQIAGELITGEPAESYTNAHMERGKIMEDEARRFYAFTHDAEVQRVGFIRNGDAGCSPDGLVGDKGSHEIKTKLPDLVIECILRDDFPPEHKAQCQGVLWLAEREWIDLTIFWPKMPGYTVRAYRDEPYIAKLQSEVARFNEELDRLAARIRAYDARQAA